MPIYEVLPTSQLSRENMIISNELLPELVHLEDSAKTVFVDFSRNLPATVTPQTPIDVALHEMRARHLQILLVEENNHVIGLVSQQDMLSEQPLRLMQENNLTRSEITVEMLMKPRREILTVEFEALKNAQVGHIITTIKKNNANFILVVKRIRANKHIIKGLFSAAQIGKQLHSDLSSILSKSPETIADLHKDRKT